MAKQQGKKTKPVETENVELEGQTQLTNTEVVEENVETTVEEVAENQEQAGEEVEATENNEQHAEPEESTETIGTDDGSVEEVPSEPEAESEAEETDEPNNQLEPSNKNEDVLSNERILEIAEQINNEGKSLNNINELTSETERALREKVANLEALEKELKDDIKKNESALKEENNTNAQKLFRRGFSEFWNGVSDGWNN